MKSRLRVLGLIAVAAIPLAFAGLALVAMGDPEDGLDRIPAAIVNEDEMVTTTDADGNESPFVAGRALVTELTGDDSPGMDWQLSNSEDAAALLASGEVYAVLTIPEDFSASIVSLQGDDPQRADLEITTDDAHNFVAGSVAQALGDGMARTFGSQITEQYIAGIYSSFGTIGDSLQQAADGAGELADGASSAADGAGDLATGLDRYTGGVSQLASGLKQLDAGAARLDSLASGVKKYTGGVSQISAALTAAVADLAANPNDPVALGTVQYLTGQLSTAAAGGAKLSAGTASGINGIQSGISQSASGASQLAANGPSIAQGTHDLASGISKLADGATDLSTGLQEGADQLPSDAGADDTAAIVADPVNMTVTTENTLSGPGAAVASIFIPLGLWIGALAVFLIVRPASRRMLASTATSGRLVTSTLSRAGVVTLASAALLVLLLHTAAGVSWGVLWATLPFALLIAAAFTAFHYLLTIGLGRGGLVISILLLAVQVATVGGVLPVEALGGPFPWIRPFLPLSWAVDGMQQLVTGGSPGLVVGAAFALLALTIGSVLVALLAVRRERARVLRPAVI
jgi:putative membrane protein